MNKLVLLACQCGLRIITDLDKVWCDCGRGYSKGEEGYERIYVGHDLERKRFFERFRHQLI